MLAEHGDRTIASAVNGKKRVVIRKIALESTPPRHNDGAGHRALARLESSFQFQKGWKGAGRRVLCQSEMIPVLVVVEHVLRDQPFEIPLIQDDHVVKQISSTTSNPALVPG
jgi:hypothetical protein